MTIELTLDENDFLTHQLFLASKSDRIRRKRQRSRFILPFIYLFFSLLFLLEERQGLAIVFFLFGLFWFIGFPYWDRKRYIKHYQGFIREHYKDRLGKGGTLEFTDEYITARDNGSESKVRTSEVEAINEVPSALFVRLKGGQSFILPKDKIRDPDQLIQRLKQLAGHLQIHYTVEESWAWK
ncbi:MAG TPA: YcxB family protein [Chitinophagaceae bacterium]|jgi:hypothetical protein|nr:YcxB family protein [Chitinophagaceae bacterium]